MHTHQQVWSRLQQHKLMGFVVKISMAIMLGLLFMGISLGMNTTRAHAQSVCAGGDRTYNVVWGDTLGGIAARYGTTYPRLASYNHIANPNLIYVNQVVCIPGRGSVTGTSWYNAPVSKPAPTYSWYSVPVQTDSVPTGSYNVFPYPACTWWADQRYYQLHGVFVPWRTNAEAWQWTARAYDFGWHVSSYPTWGAIVDLQPWVEGAYGGGHVAVVERILSNGHVIASNMSWGAYPYQVTYVEFIPGPGVTFISQ